jgi:predicted nucleic acid-binding protein
MCIIIDTNVFGDLKEDSAMYPEFEPVIDWIRNGKGTKFVFGGSKYNNELKRAFKYLQFFANFQRMNKIVRVDDKRVDEREREIKKKNRRSDFNDEHLVAIVIESGCRLVCTKDKTAAPFIKDRTLYPKPSKPPKIYSGKHNKNLLVDCNIAPICKDRKGPGRQ